MSKTGEAGPHLITACFATSLLSSVYLRRTSLLWVAFIVQQQQSEHTTQKTRVPSVTVHEYVVVQSVPHALPPQLFYCPHCPKRCSSAGGGGEEGVATVEARGSRAPRRHRKHRPSLRPPSLLPPLPPSLPHHHMSQRLSGCSHNAPRHHPQCRPQYLYPNSKRREYRGLEIRRPGATMPVSPVSLSRSLSASRVYLILRSRRGGE